MNAKKIDLFLQPWIYNNVMVISSNLISSPTHQVAWTHSLRATLVSSHYHTIINVFCRKTCATLPKYWVFDCFVKLHIVLMWNKLISCHNLSEPLIKLSRKIPLGALETGELLGFEGAAWQWPHCYTFTHKLAIFAYIDMLDAPFSQILVQVEAETGIKRPISYLLKQLLGMQHRWLAKEKEA